MCGVGSLDGIVKTRLIVKSLPGAVFPIKVPGFSFARFPPHRMCASFLKRMQRDHIGRIAAFGKKSAQEAVSKTYRRVQIGDVVVSRATSNMLCEPPGEFEFAKTFPHFFVRNKVFAKKEINVMTQRFEMAAEIINDRGSP